MQVHFYKLHIGGNAFILVLTETVQELKRAGYGSAAAKLCSRRYGVGASGCIFLSPDNTLQVFSPAGTETAEAPDALFCAARYAFDSGRVEKTAAGNTAVKFNTQKGSLYLTVLSSREFQLNLGSPFSLVSGKVLTPDFSDCMENYTIDGKPVCVSGIHIGSDILVARPQSGFSISFLEFYIKLRKNFHGRQVFPVFARAVTRETLSIRTIKHGTGTSSASAAAALVASCLAGSSDTAAVCTFEQGNPALFRQQSYLADDIDNSRKLAVVWNTAQNELQAIGTGGYLFEGNFEL